MHPSYVCNSCKRRSACPLVNYYRALPPYNQYKNTLSTSRQGCNLSFEDLIRLDNLVSPLLKNSQPISHICQTPNIGCSKSSLYNYLDKNYLSARNIDLPRRVRYPKRKSKLMLVFLLNDKTSNSALKVFNWLEALLGNNLFEKTFPVILTGNGTEFSNPLSLEFNN